MKLSKLILCAVVVATSCSFSVSAYEYKQAVDHAVNEQLECASYYAVMYGILLVSNGKEEKENIPKLEKIGGELISLSQELLKDLNQSKQQALNSVTQKLKVLREEMMEEINYNPANFSTLSNKYRAKCKIITEHPEIRFDYWLAK